MLTKAKSRRWSEGGHVESDDESKYDSQTNQETNSENGMTSQKVRKFGCLKCEPKSASTCTGRLYVVLVLIIFLYNIFSLCWAVMFLVSSLFELISKKETDDKWCPSLDINIFLLQFQSALLYFYGVWILKQKWTDEEIKSKNSKCLWFFVIIILLLTWITGFTTVVDEENWVFGSGFIARNVEILLYALDFVRYWPPAIIIIMLHGHLDTFESELAKIKKNKLDYIKAFEEKVKPFEDALKRFSGFIVALFICNFIAMCIVFIALVRHFLGSGCHVSVWYHFHYSAEICYFLILWAILIFVLNKNHRLIVEQRYDIMHTGDPNNIHILFYLKSVIERYSPFSINICGVRIPPSNRMLLAIVCSVVIPTIVRVIDSAQSF